MAVRELHKKDQTFLAKVELFQNYKVDKRHLVPLYAEFILWDTPLTIDEAEILGFETTVLISSKREQFRSKISGNGGSLLPESVSEADVL